MCHDQKNLKRAILIAKTAFKKDGYGPIFDHSPLLELNGIKRTIETGIRSKTWVI